MTFHYVKMSRIKIVFFHVELNVILSVVAANIK